MRKAVLNTGAALLCVGFLAGCKADSVFCRAAKPPPPVVLPKVTASNPYPIPVQADCTNANSQVDVVHIVIFNVDDPNFESSALLHLKSDPKGDMSQGKTVKPKPTVMAGHQTDVDFDAAEYLKKKGDLVLIELELQDPSGVSFAAGANTAVFTSDATNGQMFCVKQPMRVAKGDKLVRFYARWVPVGSNGKALVGAYTFAYDDASGSRHFVILDPDVKNEG